MTKNKRKASTPWDMPETPWKTKSAFYGWLRGQIRRGWTKHPVKNLYLKQKRKRITNPNKKSKVKKIWGARCEQCTKLFPQSKLQVDHIIPAGSLSSFNDIEPFITKLFFVTFDDLQLLCKDCHAIKTYADKQDMSFEEAKIEKEVVDMMSNKASIVRTFVEKNGHEYITPKSENKTTVRRILRDKKAK